MEKWKKELIKYQNDNNLNREEIIYLINKNGGEIDRAGYSHWMNDGERHRRPSIKNCKAIEKLLYPNLYFYSENKKPPK